GLGRTNLIYHEIDVGDAKPVKQRHFPVSPAVEKSMYAEIDRMLQLGVIEESESSWSSLIVMVTKPGKVRMCLDCWKVNSFTSKDAYPLPQISAVLVQNSEEGDERPIAFISKKLNKAQRNYTVTEQECLAAIWLMSNTDLSTRLARWALSLQRYRFTIEHRKGSQNVVPDVLSRLNENEIATIDLRDGLLVDMKSDCFQSQEYVDLLKLVKENGNNFPDLKVEDGYLYRKA
ncbi:hypothetical protein KR067_002277, partial [Drosophila pandora]